MKAQAPRRLGPLFRRLVLELALLAGVLPAAWGAPFAYVARNETGQLAVIDLATNAVVTNVTVGSSPLGVAVDPTGSRVYVSNPESGTVSVINTASNTVLRTISSVGSGPFGVAVNAGGTRLAVALAGGASPGNMIAVYDTSSFARVGTATVGSGPTGLTFNPAGTRLYVANTDSHTISVLDASSLAVLATIPVREGPIHLVPNAAGTRLYVAHIGTADLDVNRVSVVDLASNTVLAVIPVGTNPVGVAINPAGTRVAVANGGSDNVSLIDTATNAVVSTIVAGESPVSVGFHPDGSRLYVVNSLSENMMTFDMSSLARVATLAISGTPLSFGNFISPQTGSSGANAPGALSGLWWNPAESGWGISFTQRGSIIFAAWYTYDDGGNPRWYVASDCRMANASSCSGTLYQVAGPRFFGVPFNASAVAASPAGTLNMSFQGSNSATMSYSLGGQARTVSLTRQVFQPSGTAPATNYTDLWWNPNESGWGLSVTQQFNLMFLAWYVYDNSGNPVWYVASSCAVTSGGNGCSGTLYRTTGPAFGPGFDPAQVQVFSVGSVTLTFSNGNNGALSYVVDGVPGSKAITRQLF